MPTAASSHRAFGVRMLNGESGLHLVVLDLAIDQWRVPWSLRSNLGLK
ncbi:MAG: hypothetical protein IGS50_08550 [Synechococcales cyanobacterium C42_A2020_086]|nr:hypothetical protein [Synechococcales cyanobacterium C42_A2020_086]